MQMRRHNHSRKCSEVVGWCLPFIESLWVGQLQGKINKVNSNIRSGTVNGGTNFWNNEQLLLDFPTTQSNTSMFYLVVVSLRNSVY